MMERNKEAVIGEVRKGLSSVFRVSIGEFNGRSYVYCQLFWKDEGDAGPGERARAGLTFRPEMLRDLLPLFSQALEAVTARDEGRESPGMGQGPAVNGPGEANP